MTKLFCHTEQQNKKANKYAAADFPRQIFYKKFFKNFSKTY